MSSIKGYRVARGFQGGTALFQASTLCLLLTEGYLLAAISPAVFLIVALSLVIFYTRKINQLRRQVDWAHVRAMELENFGQAFHDLDGKVIPR